MHVTEVHAKSVMRAQQFGVGGHLWFTPCGGEEYGTLLKNVKLFILLPFIMLTIYSVDKPTFLSLATMTAITWT